MDYESSTEGEIKITVPDPMDVIPDPDAKDYDPDEWSDVRYCRWLTARQIEGIYGKAAAEEVEANSTVYCDVNFGEEDVRRDGFGLPLSYANGWGWYQDGSQNRRFRIVDQQSHEYANTLVAIFPTGDLRNVEGLDPQK